MIFLLLIHLKIRTEAKKMGRKSARCFSIKRQRKAAKTQPNIIQIIPFLFPLRPCTYCVSSPFVVVRCGHNLDVELLSTKDCVQVPSSASCELDSGNIFELWSVNILRLQLSCVVLPYLYSSRWSVTVVAK